MTSVLSQGGLGGARRGSTSEKRGWIHKRRWEEFSKCNGQNGKQNKHLPASQPARVAADPSRAVKIY